MDSQTDAQTDAEELVRAYWARTHARDWDGVRALLADDLVVQWPVSGERFTGAEAFVAVNRAYPQGWSIDVRTVVAQGDTVVSEVFVPHVEFGTSVALSVWQVRGGRISRGREYWSEPGSQEPPAWRAAYADRADTTDDTTDDTTG